MVDQAEEGEKKKKRDKVVPSVLEYLTIYHGSD
jgi:hypothetical protein